MFWVDLTKLDFAAEASVKVLRLGPDQSAVHAGETSAQFVVAEPFAFQGVRE